MCQWPFGLHLPDTCSRIQLLRFHQWLMPVILVTQEAEIRRITVWSQLRQKYSTQKGPVEWLIEHVPSSYEALCSYPSTIQKMKKKFKMTAAEPEINNCEVVCAVHPWNWSYVGYPSPVNFHECIIYKSAIGASNEHVTQPWPIRATHALVSSD
jgi:hypothetical protein